MRSEYYSSKEQQGASFFPGGPLDYTDSELSGSGMNTQRVSVQPGQKPPIILRELKAVRQAHEAVTALATKVEDEFQLLLNEESALVQATQELQSIEQVIKTRRAMLKQLEHDILSKRKNLEQTQKILEDGRSKLAQETLEYEKQQSMLSEKAGLVGRKQKELQGRQKALAESRLGVVMTKADQYNSRLDQIRALADWGRGSVKEDWADPNPSDYLNIEQIHQSKHVLKIQRLRRELAAQHARNAELFVRVRKLAPGTD